MFTSESLTYGGVGSVALVVDVSLVVEVVAELAAEGLLVGVVVRARVEDPAEGVETALVRVIVLRARANVPPERNRIRK